jgi:hypothetical protein
MCVVGCFQLFVFPDKAASRQWFGLDRAPTPWRSNLHQDWTEGDCVIWRLSVQFVISDRQGSLQIMDGADPAPHLGEVASCTRIGQQGGT